MADIYVAPDGRVFTNSNWDEAGREAGIYKDGDVFANPWYTHGWGYLGGRAVTANNTYLYLAQRMDSEGGRLIDANTWPVNGRYWFGITRRPLSNPATAAPFPGGKGGAGGTLTGSFLVLHDVPQGTDASISGLAASDTRLYVSDPYASQIRVYDANSMTPVSAFPFVRPGKLVVDARGTLWIIQEGDAANTPKILHYTVNGTRLAEQITDVAEPSDLAVDSQNRLLVAEYGPRQQILIYDISGAPFLAATLGTPAGLYSGRPGEIGDLKLASPSGVGADSAGNIYAASSFTGTDIRKFSPAGQMLWALRGQVFLDAAVADSASDGADVYTAEDHFVMDYSKSNGHEAAWKGITIDRFRYPNDPRLFPGISRDHPTVLAVRNISGRKYLFVTDQYSQYLQIYRMEGEIGVPSGFIAQRHVPDWLPGIQPATGRWIWRDVNGNGNFEGNEFFDADGAEVYGVWGWDVDNAGNVWQTHEGGDGVRRYALQGVDPAGNLIYTRPASNSYGIPAPFTQLERVIYIAENDTLYLAGYTAQRPMGSGYWGQAGTELARYDNWSKGNRVARWRIALTYDPANSRTVKAIAVAGQRVFAGLLGSSKTENVFVYDTETGAQVGLLAPGPEVGSNMGWVDASHTVRAHLRTNGEYLVFVEEVYWQKVLVYRFAGPPPQVVSVAVTPATATLSASETKQFAATVTGSSNTAVTWSVTPAIGTISAAGVYSAPGAITAPATVVVTAMSVADTAKFASATISLTAPIVTSTTAPRVNAGGAAYTDPSGQTWSADTGFAGGNQHSTGASIAGTTTPALYQSSRWSHDAFQYQFALPNGTYNVTLKFAEPYYTGAGQRVFDVAINGQTVLSRLDLVSAAGGAFRAVDRQFTATAASGQIAIRFSPVVAQPMVNAIEISAASAASVSVSPSAVSLGGSRTQQFTATVPVTWSLSPAVGTITSAGLYTAPASVTASQTVKVIAISATDPAKTAFATVTITPAAVQPILVNAGGPAYTDPQGRLWSADSNYSGGYANSSGIPISRTDTPLLYQSVRWNSGPVVYQFTVPAGSYAVKLKFAELYYKKKNHRVFDIVLNGQTVLARFDTVAQAGGPGIAIDKQFTVTTPGQITIRLNPAVREPSVNAIEIVPM